MKKKPTNVLITGIGGPTPSGIARALKKFSDYGPYHIIGTDCNPRSLGLYAKKYVDQAYLVTPIGDKNYWVEIKKIIKNEKIDVAVIQPELEVEGWARYQIESDPPCPALIPNIKLVKNFRDKSKMNDLLNSTNLIPKSVKVNKKEINFEALKKLGYPFWLRGARGSSGIGALKIDNEETLVNWIGVNKNIEEFTASEFLPGRNLAVKALFYNGKFLRGAVGERVNYIMSKVAPSGITGNTSFGRLLNYPEAAEIGLECLKMVGKKLNCDLNGFFTVDLKEDEKGTPKVTEVNVRHVAFTSLFAEAGANLAEDMVQVALGRIGSIGGKGVHHFNKNYVFLREVDAEPILLEEDDLFE